MSASKKKFRGFWYRDFYDFALVTGRGRDSDLRLGDIVISVNGRREGPINDALQKVGKKALEVIDAHSGLIKRITVESNHGGTGDAREDAAMAYHWVIYGASRRAIKEPFRQPDDLDRTNQSLLRQRRILANHLRECIKSNRAAHSCIAATSLRLGSEISDKVATIEALRAERDALELERNELKARLFESNRSRERMVNDIERLSKAANRRRITHIKLGNELFRNRTKEHV